jgi:hypothetical protein
MDNSRNHVELLESLLGGILFRSFLGGTVAHLNHFVFLEDLTFKSTFGRSFAPTPSHSILARTLLFQCLVFRMNLEVVLEVSQDLILVIVVLGDQVGNVNVELNGLEDDISDQIHILGIQIDRAQEGLVDVLQDVDILPTFAALVDMLGDDHELGEAKPLREKSQLISAHEANLEFREETLVDVVGGDVAVIEIDRDDGTEQGVSEKLHGFIRVFEER